METFILILLVFAILKLFKIGLDLFLFKVCVNPLIRQTCKNLERVRPKIRHNSQFTYVTINPVDNTPAVTFEMFNMEVQNIRIQGGASIKNTQLQLIDIVYLSRILNKLIAKYNPKS